MAKHQIVKIGNSPLAKSRLNIGAVDTLVDLGQRWWPVMTIGYAALLSAYADATKLLPTLGWVDIAAFSVIGALVLTCLSLVSFAAYRHTRPALLPAHDRKEFSEEIVTLSDLVGVGALLISHKVFKRCVIRGPGQIKFQSQIETLFCSIEQKNVVVRSEGANITGAVIAVNCTFIECHFDNLAIVGTQQDVALVRSAFQFISFENWERKYAR
jgi:hypothetical protein